MGVLNLALFTHNHIAFLLKTYINN